MKYVFHNLKNNFFILAFNLVLILLAFNYPILIIIIIFYNFYIYKKDKLIFYANLNISVLMIVTYILVKLYQEYLIIHCTGNITGKITKIEDTNFYTLITVRYKIFKVQVYDYEKNNYELGMIVDVKGIIKEIESNHLPNGFNYEKYFYHNFYLLKLRATEITIKRKGFSIYFLSELIEKWIKFFNEDDSLIILEGFILGNTDNFTQEFKESLRINGIIHLFAVSGLHVSIIISILDKIFGKMKHKNSLINVILGMYLMITRFLISISRAIFTYFLKEYLEYKGINLTSLDITSIIFISFLLINPYFFYNLGFDLSFFATFVIILLNESIKNMNKIKSLLLITIVINTLTLPILINSNNNFNLLTPLLNLIMVFLVETIILPLSFLVFILPILSKPFNYVVLSFIELSKFLSKLSKSLNLVLIIGSISFTLWIIFYLLIYLFLKTYQVNKKLNRIIVGLFIVFLGFIYFNGSFTLTPTITFFDVSVGDATLIEYKDEKVLIDTGIGRNNELKKSLESKGVKKLDYLIITHNHSDHNGEVETIINEINVKNIVTSKFDDSIYSTFSNSVMIKKGDILKTKYLKFTCLSPLIYSNNINNNSLVLLLDILDTKLLFTGDCEKEVEKDIKPVDIDILKVAHHGSNTSTTDAFLEKTTPEYAVIESGRSNSFEFPSTEVINRLRKHHITTFITKYNYTITLKIKKNNNFYFSSLKS